MNSAALVEWAGLYVAALEQHAAELDRINVYPVADADTGSNLLTTMGAALATVRGGDAVAVALSLADGAFLGAHGNSGVILSQVLRGLADALTEQRSHILHHALRRGRHLAAAALSEPREGTALTVLAVAAEAIEPHRAVELTSMSPLAVIATTAAEAAARAVSATTTQLPELAQAGVVDAGGLGIWLMLDALAAQLHGRPCSAELPAPSEQAPPATELAEDSSEFDYEVMYVLKAVAIGSLREDLVALGGSVAIIGDNRNRWTIHLHCNDADAALAAGHAHGELQGVAVTRLHPLRPSGNEG